MFNHIGLLHHPKIAEASHLAQKVKQLLAQSKRESTIISAWDQEAILSVLPSLDLVITLGGDGSILRTARLVAPFNLPILGVNLGRLGFLAELQPDELLERLPAIIDGNCWIEERAMLRAEWEGESYDALNDVVVARGAFPRVIHLQINIDNTPYGAFIADGVVVATPTGSTGYALAADGPVLHPQVPCHLLTLICPHLAAGRSLVLPETAKVKVWVGAEPPAVLSIDGQMDFPFSGGAAVTIAASPYHCRFLRGRPKGYFYSFLSERLLTNNGAVKP